MRIQKKSMFTGKMNTMDIDVTIEQLNAWSTGGELIQHAMSNLTDNEREFIMNGVTPEE